MKKYIVLPIILLFCMSVSAQVIEEMDALNYSRTQMMGTARYMSMGGAFTSLGADISSITQNPAGVAVYRSSELSTTFGLNFTNTKTNQLGARNDENMTKLSFNNIGYVGTTKLRTSGTGLMNWNFGFVYNRQRSFDRDYYTEGSPINGGNSLADYIAYKTNQLDVPERDMQFGDRYDAYYDSGIPWLSILGYQGYLISPIENSNNLYMSELNKSNFLGNSLYVTERGHVDEYNLALGFNYSNILYFGINVGIMDIVYDMSSYYLEDFSIPGVSDRFDGYDLINHRSLDGAGVNVKLGAILQPTYSWRIGLAYHSPTWYDISTSYIAAIENIDHSSAETPGYSRGEIPFTDFELQTPQKLLVGTSFVGSKGVISFDYEFCDYSSIKVKEYGHDVTPPMKDILKPTHSIRVGGEYVVSPSFLLRAGYAHVTSPMEDDVKDGGVEMFTSGTAPHYTIDKGTNYFSFGFGYKYKNVFLDMAYVLNQQKEDVYAFSPVFDANSEPVIIPTPASMTTNRNSVLLTFGVKF